MAIPTVYAVGAQGQTNNAGGGTATPALPTGTTTGDLLIMFMETGNQPVPALTGWSNVGVGIVQQASGLVTALTVRWKIAGAGETAPSLSASSIDHVVARIVGVRGHDPAAPFNITATGVDNTASTSTSIPGATTTIADCLVFAAFSTGTDVTSTAQASAWANASLATVTEQCDNWHVTGNGGGFGVATGGKAAVGAYNATTVTIATANTKATMSFAVAPAPVVTAFSGAAALTGTGTLTRAGVPSPTGAAASGAAGTLVAAGAAAVPAAPAFTASGVLVVAGQAVASVVFTASGALTAPAAAAAAGAGAFTGSGVLSVAGVPAPVRAVALTGSGALTRAGTIGTAGVGVLAGSGALNVGGLPAAAGPVALAGSGALTSTPAVAATGSVQPATVGTLSVVSGGFTGVAAFAAAGTLSAAGVTGYAGTTAFTAAGALTTVGVARYAAPSTFTAAGTLAAFTAVGLAVAAAFTGSGQLVVVGVADTGGLAGEWWITRRPVAGRTGRPDRGTTPKG